MRKKLEMQFSARDCWNLKFVRGGLVDIEFVTEFLQLRHAWETPDILEPNTISALGRLRASGFLSESDAQILMDTARLELDLLQILRLAVAGTFNPERATPAMKALLLRAAGAEDFGALEQQLKSAEFATCAIFDKLLPS
jgi:glutamate-ammonia-ligase adenylyltransferase